MKVFAYTKEQKPKKVATITDVKEVAEHKGDKSIVIRCRNGIEMKFDTTKIKTTIYQN